MRKIGALGALAAIAAIADMPTGGQSNNGEGARRASPRNPPVPNAEKQAKAEAKRQRKNAKRLAVVGVTEDAT